jgi:excisionase family DNA binding protein
VNKAPESALTVRQVAEYLNVNEKTVYRLAKRGDLPGFKVAGAWRFRRRDIDLWIDRKTHRTHVGNEA